MASSRRVAAAAYASAVSLTKCNMNAVLLVAAALSVLVVGPLGSVEQEIRVEPEQDLIARIKSVTGEAPELCGQMMHPGNWGRPAYQVRDLDGPIQCARAAARQHRAFFFVLKGLGFDSWTASGLLGDSAGQMQFFTYDNLYGHGTLRLRACLAPTGQVNADGFVYVACGT